MATLTSLVSAITSKFSSDLTIFNANVAARFNLTGDQVKSVWTTVATAPPPPTKAPSRRADPNGPKCVYIFQKGKNPGTSCGKPCAEESSFCKTHNKDGGAKGGKSSLIQAAKDMLTDSVKPTAPKAAQQLHLAPNAYGNYEHKPTSLVFNKDKKVFGKQVGDKVMSLSQADITMCIRYGFAYLPEAVAKPETPQPRPNEAVVSEEIDLGDLEAEEEEVEVVEEEVVEEDVVDEDE